MTFANKAIKYFLNLGTPANLPKTISVINPYEKEDVKKTVKEFFAKYYDDQEERVFIFGINPGRFGGGLTGISFTDPVALREKCGIENSFGTRKEISSEFVYKVIEEYGGTDKFFSRFFLSALFPLAIIKNGINYNYYDEPELLKVLHSEIVLSIRKQTAFGANRKNVISFGRKNGEFLKRFNGELELFNKVETLDHPRFIMQYKRKSLNKFIDEYLGVFNMVVKS
ncbi:MAG: DUF4918 family protein [Ignavibacteriales bacterium]|nr:DUF4918 family protein [Ignavibacteriales bacterium]